MIKLNQSQTEKLTAICEKHFVANLFLFGSAVRDTFKPDSDLDFAVLFSKELTPLEHGDAFFSLKEDLEELFDREIDLIAYRSVKNAIFKRELDETKVELYAA